MNSTEETPVQSICLSCGMCCDGTLFDFAPIKPEDDLSALLAAGNTVVKREAESHLNLPCAAHIDNRCQIYNQPRPTICHTYHCLLLKRYSNEKISYEEAQVKVIRAQELKDNYKTVLARIAPESRNMPVVESKKLIPEHEAMLADRELLKKWAPAAMALAMLMDFLQENFHKRR